MGTALLDGKRPVSDPQKIDFELSFEYFGGLRLMETGLHVTVRGLVQGVGFRYFVFRKAVALDVRGYVRNQYDGSVEIVAQGERALLEDLLSAVRVGPRSAAVRDVAVEWTAPTHDFSDFEVR